MGRRLADREPEVNIFGEVHKRKCDVATIGGLSGHAGQDLLTKYALGVKDSAKQIFLVHGEERQAMTLQNLLKERGVPQTYYPELHEGVEI
jgi:metallo-beta-lactamase family protein